MKLKTLVILLAAEFMYVGAFLLVHRPSPGILRQWGANGNNWYYSDCRPIEFVEFYGFWPLRHLAYHVPGYPSHHLADWIDPVPELIKMGFKG